MKIIKIMLITCICLVLAACNKVSESNFDKIKENMKLSDVVSILGEPTTSNSISVAGVSGTSAVWKDDKNEITIQFLNGTVFLKTFNEVDKGK